ncbi:MAG: SCP2 sterol-binding domain-containing protein [Chitinophagales bacterium]|nr:SCP2 sterol-binding domain-containing protein [Chitinophagales bacterium]
MEMTTIIEKISARASNMDPIGNSIKFKMGDQVVFIDGKGDSNIVSEDDADADCTISMKEENFKKLIAGDLNPMTALMTGKIKIDGDMSVALKLQSLLG